jgi:hypothetical protein
MKRLPNGVDTVELHRIDDGEGWYGSSVRGLFSGKAEKGEE